MTECPNCDGAGVVDNSPAAVTRAPWLQSDRPCHLCDGAGEVTPEQVAAWREGYEAALRDREAS